MPGATNSLIHEIFVSHDLPWWGAARLERPHTFEFYRNWLEAGHHADMDYLVQHAPQKQAPESVMPTARSALVVAVNYRPHPEPNENFNLRNLRVAAYAQGSDYHLWLKRRLQSVIADLKKHFPSDQFLAMTDSHPVLERDLAKRAGLGWFGKNTCLIHSGRGSLFLIGEIYTSLQLTLEVKVSPDHCGSCQRCLEACPTQALTAPRVLDSRRCISYWTIESRLVPPPELRLAIGEWFFGCDVCQTVCPWNEKVFGLELRVDNQISTATRDGLIAELKWILESSNKKLMRQLEGTPLTRAGGRGLKRNAMLVAARHCLSELEDSIAAYIEHPDLGELASWTIRLLKNGP